MKISLCITTYNRYELTLQSFAKVLKDDRITEIVIVDDASVWDIYEKVVRDTGGMDKVMLFRNAENLGMSRNKCEAINQAENDWCIIFDSDNVIDTNYLDALERTELLEDVIYMPEAALPNFDFTKFSGLYFNKNSVANYMNEPNFRICLNTCNYVVHRDTYLKTYKYDEKIKATDTIQHNYNHLKSGGAFFIVPGMIYEHKVHNGSGFLADVNFNMAKAAEFEKKIRHL